ncbi:hypothetical protein [Streptomyces abyssomicinicus]|uniref:hypothetical protein n=1 Tax=Streptomyces abyssomicinicus TaxID=574929 RepID=UPI0013DFF611|nr:hypothetical protein [Streptomyces abyssomicinicus]
MADPGPKDPFEALHAHLKRAHSLLRIAREIMLETQKILRMARETLIVLRQPWSPGAR